MCYLSSFVIVCGQAVRVPDAATAVSTLSLDGLQNTTNTCSSSYSEYLCGDGGCVSVSAVCDGNQDCSDGSDEASCDSKPLDVYVEDETLTRRKRQSTRSCGKGKWRCKDGTCIDFDGECDGKVDCPDGSDETFALCRNNQCHAPWFRCTYGSCVDGTAPCNNIQDCADNSDELLPRCRNETQEVNGRFKCADGSTIPAYELCDGVKDCVDGSDETLRACAGKICASYVFQCAYGACVDAKSDCNGKVECADGSDESDELCNRSGAVDPNPQPSGPCVLPPFPAHGSYIVSGEPNAKPGQAFYTVAFNVTCHPGYRVIGKSERICFAGSWSDDSEVNCVHFCRLNKDPSVEYNCALTDGSSGTRPCGEFEPDGTTVIPTCRTPDYFFIGVLGYMHCVEGSWDYIARCSPECGLVTPDGTGLIAGPEGKPAKKGELPWHAGIYRSNGTTGSYDQICGGSLVSAKIVISAAHCFWGVTSKRSASLYAVAVGKIHRGWDDENDPEKDVQRSNVKEVYLPPHFQGSRTNFQNDLAVVQLKQTITYYPHVRPICISFDLVFQNRQLREGRKGKVAGWGLTGANDAPSEILKTVELPFVSVEECLLESPPHFRVYITGDKICAGFRNGSAVCHGDSGGGLTFPERDERGLERYYLRGVVSTAPDDGNQCNVNWLTTFTLLSRLEDFVKPFL